MIQGTFGNEVQLFFEIELITADGLNLSVNAMLDTSFTGFMAISKQDLDRLVFYTSGRTANCTGRSKILYLFG